MNLQFVLVPGHRNQSQRDRELQHSAIRSHAARNRHLKPVENSKATPRISKCRCCIGQAVCRNINPKLTTKSRGKVEAQDEHSSVSEDKPSLHLLSPASLLGARKDPFSDRNLPTGLGNALEYAMTVVFPAFLVPRTNHDMLAVQMSWRQAGAHYPFMFHAQAVAASGLLMVVWQNEKIASSILKDRLEHQSYALRAMHDVLMNPDTTLITDVLIKAILALGYFSGEPVKGKNVWVHPPSPMATAQSIHAMGGLELVPSHLRALDMIVTRRGGFEKVQLYAMKDLLELTDIVRSSRLNVSPLYAWHRGPQSLLADSRIIPDVEALDFMGQTGDQLRHMDLINPELRDLLLEACHLTAAIDQYHRLAITQFPRSNHPCPTLKDLILSRNWIHHSLLSLPRLTKSPDAEDASASQQVLENTVRIAALIYSDMVIFPLPYVTQVKPRLAASLRKALNHPLLKHIWYQPGYSELVTWALVMGAIAATGTKNRPWYLYKLIDLFHIQRITGWSSLLKLVKGFLWWDFVCDIPANKLWDDICEEKGANRAEDDFVVKLSMDEEYSNWNEHVKTGSTATESIFDGSSWSGWDSEEYERSRSKSSDLPAAQ